jgi:D-alanyl-D-alanine carboxypeptidase
MKKSHYKKKQKSLFPRLFYFTAFALLLSFFPTPNVYFNYVPRTQSVFTAKDIDLPPPPLIPQQRAASLPPSVSAQGVYIVDLPSGVVLYQKNQNTRFLPASTTKIATALVSLDHYHLDDVLTVKTVVNEGRVMGLAPGEQITVESLLYGALVHSANDAAFTLAENYPGGITNFIAAMNKKAKELNLSDTHFANPVGFDDGENYTTPSDLAKLAKVAVENKTIAKIIGIKSITVSDVNFTYFHNLKNVNELLGRVSGVAGVKTGFTESGGEILVSEVKRNGKQVLLVVLKSQDRFGETVKLIDWVFANFNWTKIEDVIPATKDQ